MDTEILPNEFSRIMFGLLDVYMEVVIYTFIYSFNGCVVSSLAYL